MLKLDLGAGPVSPDGFTPLGRAHGTEVFPLSRFADGSVDEIRASHVLEHFPSAQVGDVVREWVRVLKPGGKLRIAVPDFAKVAEAYLAGVPQPTEGYVVGAQADESDFHRAVFDRTRLTRLMAEAGLMLISQWTSEIPDDCAALPISLNLEGVKPHIPELSVGAVMSLPRVTWTANAMCWIEALMPHRIRPRCYTGAYWDQCLERAIEEEIAESNPAAIITIDFDTVFTRRDVAMLIQLACCYPDAAAIAPVQAARGRNSALFTVHGEATNGVVHVPASDFAKNLKRAATAHFGMTLLRTDALKRLPKPWFQHVPAPDGTWGEGRRDADVAFWDKWGDVGELYIANRIAVGHLEVMIRWPGSDLGAIHQDVADWRRSGPPQGVWK